MLNLRKAYRLARARSHAVWRRTVRGLVLAIDPSLRHELARLEHELQLKDIDELTGLYNTNAFRLARNRAEADPAVEVILWDIRNLKRVNDEISYDEGDRLLAAAGEALRQVARVYGSERMAFRATEGDEFVLLVPAGQGRVVASSVEFNFGEHQYDGFKVVLTGGWGATRAEAEARMKHYRRRRCQHLGELAERRRDD